MGSLFYRYAGFAWNALKQSYAYRMRMVIWIVYDFTVLFVQYFLWRAIFESSGGRMYDISLAKYLSYVAMTLVFGRVTAARFDGDIAEEIKNGNISMNLVKPVSYFGMMASRRIGYTIGDLVALVPMVVFVALSFSFDPVSPLVLAETAISLALSYILITVFYFLLGILAFWITNYWGLFLFKQHLFALFSGELIALSLLFKISGNGLPLSPIPFIPGPVMAGLLRGLGIVSYALPFQAMTYTPTAIYSGMITGQPAILVHLVAQVAWIAAISAVTAYAWRRAQFRITVMGG